MLFYDDNRGTCSRKVVVRTGCTYFVQFCRLDRRHPYSVIIRYLSCHSSCVICTFWKRFWRGCFNYSVSSSGILGCARGSLSVNSVRCGYDSARRSPLLVWTKHDCGATFAWTLPLGAGSQTSPPCGNGFEGFVLWCWSKFSFIFLHPISSFSVKNSMVGHQHVLDHWQYWIFDPFVVQLDCTHSPEVLFDVLEKSHASMDHCSYL